MKRFVGIGLIVLAFLLCPVAVVAIPESEPEIALPALIGILYLITFGLLLSTSPTDSHH